jgi:hypothetical protein
MLLPIPFFPFVLSPAVLPMRYHYKAVMRSFGDSFLRTASIITEKKLAAPAAHSSVSSAPPMPPLAVLFLLAAGAAPAAATVEDPAPSPSSPSPQPSPPPHKNATLAEVLPLYGLPPGIFPSTVTSFSVATNGSLVVDLASPCYVHFEYLTYFQPRVTGVLRYGSLTDLSGVQVRRFLVWFNVIRVKVDLPPPSRYVYLDIGWITRKLPAADFQSLHACEDSKRCRLSSALAAVAQWYQVSWEDFVSPSVSCAACFQAIRCVGLLLCFAGKFSPGLEI